MMTKVVKWINSKKKKDSLRDMWDNNKTANIHITGEPEGEERMVLKKYLKK